MKTLFLAILGLGIDWLFFTGAVAVALWAISLPATIELLVLIGLIPASGFSVYFAVRPLIPDRRSGRFRGVPLNFDD